MSKVELAICLASIAHDGQTDKVGEPYIFHPLRVALSLNSEEERVVAILHDTVEDTDVELKHIQEDFGHKIADAVDALSKRKGEGYFEYLRRVKENPLAKTVKIADIKDNTSPIRLYKLTPEKRIRLRKKYTDALNYLEKEDGMD